MHSNDAIEALTDAPVDPFNSQVVAAFSIAIKETRIPSSDKTSNLLMVGPDPNYSSGIFTSSLAFLCIKFLAR